MTILKLHKILTELIANGHGRRQVCVDKLHTTHPLEDDGVTVFPITSATIETHEMADDDGGWKVLASGYTATRTSLTIRAEH